MKEPGKGITFPRGFIIIASNKLKGGWTKMAWRIGWHTCWTQIAVYFLFEFW